MYTKEQVIEALIKSIPYPNQIENFDFSDDRFIGFTWRCDCFHISLDHLFVNEVIDNSLHGSNIAILLESIIKKNIH